MDADTWAMIAKAFGELTLTGFIFANWWLERNERLRIQKEHVEHLQKDIEELLDQTEQFRRTSSGGI